MTHCRLRLGTNHAVHAVPCPAVLRSVWPTDFRRRSAVQLCSAWIPPRLARAQQSEERSRGVEQQHGAARSAGYRAAVLCLTAGANHASRPESTRMSGRSAVSGGQIVSEPSNAARKSSSLAPVHQSHVLPLTTGPWRHTSGTEETVRHFLVKTLCVVCADRAETGQTQSYCVQSVSSVSVFSGVQVQIVGFLLLWYCTTHTLCSKSISYTLTMCFY